MTTDVEAFLAGDRPDHVAAYFSAAALSDAESLAEQPYAEATNGGVLLVVPGEAGRSAFESAAGIDPMRFAGDARATEGDVSHTLTDAACPAAGDGREHDLRILFAFAEPQNEEAGGLYAAGDVIHAYAQCSCGQSFSERWLADGTD
ncbi:MAG: DUF5807 family protein [Halodesulfurarchaeum sp.]